RIIGIETRRRHGYGIARAHLHPGEAMLIEMRADRRSEGPPIAAGDESHLQMRARTRRDRVDRTLRIPRTKREHLERVPSEHPLGRRKTGFAPVGVDRGAVRLSRL